MTCARRGTSEERSGAYAQTVALNFWNSSAKVVTIGVILRVLYARDSGAKIPGAVRGKLRDLDRTGDETRRILHRLNSDTQRPSGS